MNIVTASLLVFECDYEFPRVIVWDAIIDPVLVEGWLADATIAPVVGGEYSLHWPHDVGREPTLGRVTALSHLEHITVECVDAGLLQFELVELPGGSRGTSSRLRVTVEGSGDVGLDSRIRADWLTSLKQLEELLRGHPVDWQRVAARRVDRLEG